MGVLDDILAAVAQEADLEWLMIDVGDAIPEVRDLATAEFTTLRLRVLEVAARIMETRHRVRIAGLSADPVFQPPHPSLQRRTHIEEPIDGRTPRPNPQASHIGPGQRRPRTASQ